MKRLQWTCQQLISKLGWMGLGGLALLVVAVFIQMLSVLPGRQEASRIKTQLTQLRSQPQLARQYAPDEELALFYDFFPARTTLPEQLRRVHKLAADSALTVERVDYKLTRMPGTPLWRYQMSFPLYPDYATLRHFMADVLQAEPNAALEDIELLRSDDGSEALEAKLNLVFYFRDPL